MSRHAIALWVVFLSAHVLTAVAGWVYPSMPMGDVLLVYEPWSAQALRGDGVVGITDAWVYPQLALIPMLLANFLSWPLIPALGVTSAYLVSWAVLVTGLDAIAFAVLVGKRPSGSRRAAAWFWTAALLLLGPIALYRIDAIAVPLAVVGGLWLLRRPALAATLLTVGAWIKIWPGALVLAAGIASKHRGRILLTAAGTTAGIVVVLILLGADRHLFGFLTEQTGRGLQIEAVAATPFLWWGRGEVIEYSTEILTFQIAADGASIVAAILTPLMIVAVGTLTFIGVLKTKRGASFQRLFPPLALAVVVALIITNKVGSPQFQTWLIAPVVLWFVWGRTRTGVPAVLTLLLCALTCLIYPLSYDGLLRGEMVPLLLLTGRNALLIVLFVVSVRALILVPALIRVPAHVSQGKG